MPDLVLALNLALDLRIDVAQHGDETINSAVGAGEGSCGH